MAKKESIASPGTFFGQYLRFFIRDWPKNVPGDTIDSYSANKELGSAKTFRQVIDGKPFLVHCHMDDRYVTKLMGTRGLINEITSHKTYMRVAGEWNTLIILSPSPATNTQNIGWMLSMPEGTILLVWRMFDIPNCGLTNNSLSFALSRKSTRWILRRVPRGYQRSPSWRSSGNWKEACFRISCTVRYNFHLFLLILGSGTVGLLHRLMSFGIAQNSPEHGIWQKNKWSYVQTKYLRRRCSVCSCIVRSYCSCNKKSTLCTKCWGVHKSAQGSTS